MTTEADREERLRAAVVAFVEGGERPDRHRLARIEQRLLAGQRRRPRRVAWWSALVGIGLAAGAAAYWVGHGDDPSMEENDPPARPAEPAAPEPGRADAPAADAPDEGGGAADQRTDERIIYIDP